eukprot:scaffold28143_cov152-Isochrysis_galbana.AAC.1
MVHMHMPLARRRHQMRRYTWNVRAPFAYGSRAECMNSNGAPLNPRVVMATRAPGLRLAARLVKEASISSVKQVVVQNTREAATGQAAPVASPSSKQNCTLSLLVAAALQSNFACALFAHVCSSGWISIPSAPPKEYSAAAVNTARPVPDPTSTNTSPGSGANHAST